MEVAATELLQAIRSQRKTVAVTLAVLGLVCANLLFNVVMIRFMEDYFSRSAWLDQIPISVLLSQLTLVALWLGLGDGRWYVRLVVAIALTLSIATTIGVAEYRGSQASSGYDSGHAMVIAFMLMPMMLMTAIFAFVMRRIRGWRLTW